MIRERVLSGVKPGSIVVSARQSRNTGTDRGSAPGHHRRPGGSWLSQCHHHAAPRRRFLTASPSAPPRSLHCASSRIGRRVGLGRRLRCAVHERPLPLEVLFEWALTLPAPFRFVVSLSHGVPRPSPCSEFRAISGQPGAGRQPRRMSRPTAAIISAVRASCSLGLGSDHARMGVSVEQPERDLVEGGLDRRDLGEDVDAVAVLLDHALDAAHLALDAPQPCLRSWSLVAV